MEGIKRFSELGDGTCFLCSRLTLHKQGVETAVYYGADGVLQQVTAPPSLRVTEKNISNPLSRRGGDYPSPTTPPFPPTKSRRHW